MTSRRQSCLILTATLAVIAGLALDLYRRIWR